MFIRKTAKLNGDKSYFNYQLVESYRGPKGPRQRILLNLGAKLSLEKYELKMLANRIEEMLAGYCSAFNLPEKIEDLAVQFYEQLAHKEYQKTSSVNQETRSCFTEVQLDSLKHEDCREVGIISLALHAISELNLSYQLEKLKLTNRQIEVAIGLIIHRLSHAGSEKFAHEWLMTTSGLDEFLNCSFKHLSQSTVYRVGDKLLALKESLETYLSDKTNNLFNIHDNLLLYDLTNTYFEGSAKIHPKARHGRSKEKRTDCPLITLGLVINQEGFIKSSRIFEGNVSECGTLQNVIESMSINKAKNKPTLIMDAGFSTKDNLQYLREQKIHYITVFRNSKPVDLSDAEEFKNKSGDNVRVYLASDKETGEKILYCHSSAREKKEQSIRTKQKTSFEEGLKLIESAIHKKRGIKKYDKVLNRIGRLNEKFKLVSGLYSITVKESEGIAKSVTWIIQEDKSKNKFNGTYVLRAYGVNYSAKKLWQTYMTLTQIESSFRSLKSDIGMRPIYHHKEERIDAHLFITILSYHVMQTIRYRLKCVGITHSWETIKRLFCNYARITTRVKTKSGIARIRSTVEPTREQSTIFKALGISHNSKKIIFNY